MGHTPTPWRSLIKGGRFIITDDGIPIAECMHELKQPDGANAAFIVKACNCHDELLEACKVALNDHKYGLLPSDTRILLRKAIARAESAE
jgi:hypothetical protein